MSIIVAGTLKIKNGARSEFIEKSHESILLARNNNACDNFSISPDSIDENIVNIFEKWQSSTALNTFRDSGSDNELLALVESFNVKEYDVSD